MFQSFYWAGFECATGKNMHGEWIDQIEATEHDLRADDDYALVSELGIHTIREAVRWPLVDRGGGYDFSPIDAFVHAARRHRMEVVWDLFHYGFPEDTDPFDARFPDRLSRYAAEVAAHVCRELPGPQYFTVINEPSYFSWAAGEVGRFAPHVSGRGFELKVALVRAAIAATRAIREVCPKARFVTVDPICHVVAPVGASWGEHERAWRFNHEVVFQFMDMLAGRLLPELGGSRDLLDIVGLNYYWTNQWELDRSEHVLAPHDPRRLPLSHLIRRAARRYGGDVVVTETAAVDEARAGWIGELSETALELLRQGVPLRGVCLYPVLGMPEWHDRDRWTQMGLWDLAAGDGGLERKPHGSALRALRRAQYDLECFRRSVHRPRAAIRRAG